MTADCTGRNDQLAAVQIDWLLPRERDVHEHGGPMSSVAEARRRRLPHRLPALVAAILRVPFFVPATVIVLTGLCAVAMIGLAESARDGRGSSAAVPVVGAARKAEPECYPGRTRTAPEGGRLVRRTRPTVPA